MSHVIVIGSGAAGLSAALAASARHRVTLLTKAELGDGNSRMAQGGIAAVTAPGDSIAAHISDTLAAGAGWADPESVRILCTEGPERIGDLLALGMPFDRDGAHLARGMEAAHSAPRVLHANGAATGRALVATLVDAVRAAPITVIERAFLVELIVSGVGGEERVVGAEFLIDGGIRRFDADAVVIATGGAGRLYEHTTNPIGATGDGIAAAVRAGAALGDMEFMQFHPTALAVPSTPLISEAVRGEGAVLLDERGTRFMLAVHPEAELAPRDVLARAIADQQAAQLGRPVFLDATSLGRAQLHRRFADLTALCAEYGLDWTREPVPVTPAAHYLMGGILVDDHGRSSLTGLFAIGEAACTGVHGANRLASNSLLEALVFATRAVGSIGEPWPTSVADPQRRSPEPVAPATDAEVVDRAALQQLMWRFAGLHRDAEGLAIAEAQLARWRAPAVPLAGGRRDATGAALAAAEAAEELETANLLLLARIVVAAASARVASLGAHHRRDSVESVDISPYRETIPA